MKLFAQKLCLLLLVCIQCVAPLVHAHAFGLDNHMHHDFHMHEASTSQDAGLRATSIVKVGIVKPSIQTLAINVEGAVVSIATGLKPEKHDIVQDFALWALILGFVLLAFAPLIIRFQSTTKLRFSQPPRFTLFRAQAPPKPY